MMAARRMGLFGLGLLLLLATTSSGATSKLSEASPQIAYAAGSGDEQPAAVPVIRPRRALPVAVRSRVTTATTTTTCAGAVKSVGSSRVAYAAFVKSKAVIRKQPSSHSSVVGSESPINENGFRQVLEVVGLHTGSRCTADWYRVELPVLPNGTMGWVRAWAVQTFRVRSRIMVDVSSRRLQLYHAGKLVLDTPVAVGATSTPTPLGRYFVDERYVLPDDRGPFGPNALGISAHSDVLQHVWVDDGPIGIHGTNEPWSIGRAASHGCIRVTNSVMRRVFSLAPAGTPVVVTA